MPLKMGFTQYHGFIMDSFTAHYFRRMERNVRRHIANGFENGADYWLSQCESFAGCDEEYQQLCKAIRRDAADRWRRTWGEWSWKIGPPPQPPEPPPKPDPDESFHVRDTSNGQEIVNAEGVVVACTSDPAMAKHIKSLLVVYENMKARKASSGAPPSASRSI